MSRRVIVRETVIVPCKCGCSLSFAFTVNVVDLVPLFSVVAPGCVMTKSDAFLPLNAVATLVKSPVPVLVMVIVFVS